jgi:hypothetical protein
MLFNGHRFIITMLIVCNILLRHHSWKDGREAEVDGAWENELAEYSQTLLAVVEIVQSAPSGGSLYVYRVQLSHLIAVDEVEPQCCSPLFHNVRAQIRSIQKR